MGMSYQMMRLVSNQITNLKELGGGVGFVHIIRTPSADLDRIDSSEKTFGHIGLSLIKPRLSEHQSFNISVYHPSVCKHRQLKQEHFSFRDSVLGKNINILAMGLAQGHTDSR